LTTAERGGPHRTSSEEEKCGKRPPRHFKRRIVP
jgi:hypothetical protein